MDALKMMVPELAIILCVWLLSYLIFKQCKFKAAAYWAFVVALFSTIPLGFILIWISTSVLHQTLDTAVSLLVIGALLGGALSLVTYPTGVLLVAYGLIKYMMGKKI